MTTPQNLKQLRSFLGMINYLAKFINNLSDETKQLRELEKKEADWNWNKDHQNCFERLKNLISCGKTLKYFDPNQDVCIQCDASEYGMGAVLL